MSRILQACIEYDHYSLRGGLDIELQIEIGEQ